MKRSLLTGALVGAMLWTLLFVTTGCATPIQRAHLANLAFAGTLKTANDLHDQGRISNDALSLIREAADVARPVIAELNAVAEQYADAQARGGNPAELAAIRFRGDLVWSQVEQKLLALAQRLIEARRGQTPVTWIWPRARTSLAA